jgi:hypothetical protein
MLVAAGAGWGVASFSCADHGPRSTEQPHSVIARNEAIAGAQRPKRETSELGQGGGKTIFEKHSRGQFSIGSPPAPKCMVKTTTRAFRPASWIETIKRKAQRGPRGPAPPRPPPGPPRSAPGPAPNTGFGFIGSRPSLCSFLRASLRARRTASAFSRAFFSEGFS